MTAVLKSSNRVDSVNKHVVEETLTELTNQLAQIDETIKNRTDYEIWKLFQHQQMEIKNFESEIMNILRYR